ncbi:chloride channel [Suillus paluster]|uniref:chloride channel n=1 Tax=Suillus paluster TaxID=48578 RepID=UPI001B882A07|nr:chloride channel [Suillus paluster]KAG1725409.1 chloride channel [Suillus paluster]
MHMTRTGVQYGRLDNRDYEEEIEQIRRYEDFTTIDWIQDSIVERNRRIRNAKEAQAAHRGPRGEITPVWVWAQFWRFLSAGEPWLVISLVGIFIGVNAALISIITEWLSDIKMGYCTDGWWLNQQFCCWEVESDEEFCPSWHLWSTATPARWIIYVIFAAIFSFVAAHLVRSMAKYAAGSGISEIKCILAGFVMQGFLGYATFFIKSLTLPLVIASGLSVGKEGPSVHVACCIGAIVASWFQRFSRSQGKMREIITAASAAGVAVAFGSPIGGVLFSIEEMSQMFRIKTMWRSFVCALVATFTLSVMNPFRTGKLVLFQVTYSRDWHFFEIIFFIILGIFGGLYGAFVVKFNMQVAAFRRKHLATHGVAEAVILATLTAIIGYFNRFMRIDMTEMMSILFRECEGGGDHDNLCQMAVQWPMANSLLLATFIRMGLVVISYGAKVPAGIFVPSMAVGATFGRMVGIMVKAMYRAYPHSGIFAVCDPDAPCITPGTYAFLGAAAALSGVMRITVTVVVIMFELTGALTYILPTMIVILVTKAVGDFLGTRGIADEAIRFNDYPILEKEEHGFDVSVSEVMKKDLDILFASGMLVSDVERLLGSTNVKGFPIVASESSRTLAGYMGRTELRYVLDKAQGVGGISPNTSCAFTRQASDQEDFVLSDMTSGSALGVEEEVATELIETSATIDVLKLWPWVNQTPLTVSPRLPLEIVTQLFKRMGPRVILVEEHGLLKGLVTVKDVLRFNATEQPIGDRNWDAGELEGILDVMWNWAVGIAETSMEWYRRLIRR